MSRVDVMLSIKRNRGLKDYTKVRDTRVEGITHLMTNVCQSYKKELSVTMILEGHKM